MATINSPKIKGAQDLVEWFRQGETPAEDWLIGTEHEKFLFNVLTNRRPSYEGEAGIGALLTKLLQVTGGEAMMEGNNIIGIKDPNGGSLTLEPGGQFELSGAPLKTLHDTCRESNTHLALMRDICGGLGIGMLGVGYDPKWTRDDVPWMPKGRYKIMRAHMPTVGTLGLDMMQRTATIQVNLDYMNEADMVRKFRTSLVLQPIATAIFANSPFKEGKPSGFLSTRAETWTDTDNARSGVPSCVFDDGFGYEQWADYILNVPMYFLHRGDDYLDVAGQSFKDFMAGNLNGYAGVLPVMADWEDHVTTAFPEVRLKQYLEMRGADGGAWNMICALPALWVGLLYDDQALDAAEDLAKGFTADDVLDARMEAAKYGLKGKIGGQDMLALSRQMVSIASDGLQRRNRLSPTGDNEVSFLEPLRKITDTGITQAEDLLERYHQSWASSIDCIYDEFQF